MTRTARFDVQSPRAGVADHDGSLERPQRPPGRDRGHRRDRRPRDREARRRLRPSRRPGRRDQLVL